MKRCNNCGQLKPKIEFYKSKNRSYCKACYRDEHSHDSWVVQCRADAGLKLLQNKNRNCLKCGGVFGSEGPHNRLCKACNNFHSKSPTCVTDYLDFGYEWVSR